MKRFLYYALLVLMLLLGAAKAWIDDQLTHLAAQAVKQAQPSAAISYQQVRLALPAQVVADAVQVQTPHFPPVQIQHLHLHNTYRFVQAQLQQQTLPEDWQLSAQQVSIPLKFLKNLPNTQSLWQMFGYQTYYLSPTELHSLLGQNLNADIDLQAHWQAAQGHLDMQLQLRSDLLGNLDIQLKAQGIQARGNWQTVQIQELYFAWQPGQWLPRLSQYLGQKQNQNAAQLRQQLAQKLLQDGQNSGVLDPPAQTAIKNFIQDLQTITLHLQPAKPLSLQELLLLPPPQWQTHLGLSWQ